MDAANRVCAGKVGDRPRDPEDAIVGPRRELNLLGSTLKQSAHRGIDHTMAAELGLVHGRIVSGGGPRVAGTLAIARGLDSGGYRGGALARLGGAEIRQQ